MKHSRSAFETLARLGYAARGFVYFLLAALALFSGGWSGADNSQGALSTLLGQPFGRILLFAMALGLFGFALWRIAQGAFNADQRQHGVKDHVARAGKLVSAAAYLSLGLFALTVAVGADGGSSGGGSEDSWTATLMGLPFGPFLVGAIGAGVIGAGLGQIWKAVAKAYLKRLALPHHREKLLVPLCTYGIGARGVVFAIIGGFLVYAAFTVQPDRAVSIGEALDWVRSLPFGAVLYILGALGLLAFALTCVVYALYRRVDAPRAQHLGHTASTAASVVRTATSGRL